MNDELLKKLFEKLIGVITDQNEELSNLREAVIDLGETQSKTLRVICDIRDEFSDLNENGIHADVN